MTKQWQIQESIPSDGFECYYLLRDGITIAEICGRQTEQRTKHLNDLVSAANGSRDPAQAPTMREALEKAAHRFRELGYVDFALEALGAAQPPAAPVEMTCPGGIDPGFDECPKCGATDEEECRAAPVDTDRKTFTIPPGYEAVRDSEGVATGEVRPVDDCSKCDLPDRVNELAGVSHTSAESAPHKITLEGWNIVDDHDRRTIAKFEIWNGSKEELQSIIDRANRHATQPQSPFSLADIDQVLIAYGEATTETNVDRDRRWDAIKFVSEFLGKLRLSLTRPHGETDK